MAPGVNFVSKDGWSSVSYGWTCNHCGLERLWFSSKQCRRCGAPKHNGAQSSPAAAAQVPRRNRKRGARPTQKPSAPPEYNLAKVLNGLKENEHFKDSEELAAMQAKMEHAWEPDKLAKRQARTPEVAVQAAFSALPNRKAAMAKSQAKISELEEAAQKAAEAVEEAKQKAEKLQGEIDKLSKKSTTRSWLALSSPRIRSQIYRATCERRSRPFLGIPKPSLSLLSWKPLSQAFPASWRLQRQPPWRQRCATTRNCSWTKRRTSRTRRWPLPELSSGRCKACLRKSERPGKQRWWSSSSKGGKFSHLKRHINTVYCACSFHAASGKGPSLESLAKILVGEGLPVRESQQQTSWTITTANVTSWKSGQLMLDRIPHSDFWALQETHLPGSEQMAAAQRWSRKRGWAAFLQGAEVVGKHYAANRGGVAMGRPQHISSSVPSEFEGMLGEAAVLAPEGLEHPLKYLQSRSSEQPIRRVAGGSGQRKLARVLREQHMASPRLASIPAMARGWPGRSSWSIKWGRGCRSGWIRAEPTPSSLPTRRTWESPCQDLHSKRSTMCARHTSTPQVWGTTASTPRQFCSCQSICECVSSTSSWRSRPSWSNL